MQLSEIRDEALITVNDPTFTPELVDGYINDVYKEVVGRCLVPEMKGVDTVVRLVQQAAQGRAVG